MTCYTSPLEPAVQSQLQGREEFLWLNPSYDSSAAPQDPLFDIATVRRRLERSAPLLVRLFPELKSCNGLIRSPLIALDALAQRLQFSSEDGAWLMKCDHALPVAGSVKARGGFNEVLAFAEDLACQHKIVQDQSDLSALADPEARKLFSDFTVSVGSTGNLGLSIGLIAAALGFRSIVHMSADAKDWKKRRLRLHGIEVVEHAGDYAEAVAAGRAAAESNAKAYFVDDENSAQLFLGYAAAAMELFTQLKEANVIVDEKHPLFVYLPCGVGGAPGGITYGLKQLFGGHVHCFFAEPTESPCMLVQLSSGNTHPISVYDVGLKNRTEADGLAVAQASQLVARVVSKLVSGCYTVRDDSLFKLRYLLSEYEEIEIEPSAAAGILGPFMLLRTKAGQEYLKTWGIEGNMRNATHVVWSTGGALVPPEEQQRFHAIGRALWDRS